MRLTCRFLVVLMLCGGGFASLGVSAEMASDAASDKSGGSGSTASKPDRYIVSTGQDDQALAALRPAQATWLETESHGRVLALLEREHRSPAKGAVIIVGDVGQSADTGLTGALREPLAEAGWAAMSLGLPAPPEKMLGKSEGPGVAPSGSSMAQSDGDRMSGNDKTADKSGRAKGKAGAKSSGASEGKAVIDVMTKENDAQLRKTYASELAAHITAAERKLKDLGYSSLVIVGIGQGADSVTAWSMSGGDSRSVVWIAPRLSEGHLDALAKDGGSVGYAILDLVSAQTTGSKAADRRSRLRRNKVVHYEQQALAIPERPQAVDAVEISHRITGWGNRDRN